MDREILPPVKDLQHPWLSKPHCGLQIFDTWVDFPVPVQVVVESYRPTLQEGAFVWHTFVFSFNNILKILFIPFLVGSVCDGSSSQPYRNSSVPGLPHP